MSGLVRTIDHKENCCSTSKLCPETHFESIFGFKLSLNILNNRKIRNDEYMMNI